jgi:UDP:flavonoid glycosyltransferase YjiC (YdhE family)
MHVLFAALNWGMGHASRSVPLIRELLRQGCQVTLTSDGVGADLFRKEFPAIEVLELPGYKVSYPSDNIYLNVLLSAVHIGRAIWLEHQWIKRFIRTHRVDAVISDNRYGIRVEGIPSVLITHQLRLFGRWPWANRIGEFFIRRWSRKFDEIWVPDWSGPHALTGGMAEWTFSQPTVHYLGPLSRFQPVSGLSSKAYDLIVLLSGPEPQRSHFEEAIRKQIADIAGKHLLIRGTRDPVQSEWVHPDNLIVYDLLPAEQLQSLAAQSRMQVSRSGYSTVMDLLYSGIPALMVPTPGQFEQEFLAVHLCNRGPWVFQGQDKLDLAAAWQSLPSLSETTSMRPDGGEAQRAIQSFLGRIVNINN